MSTPERQPWQMTRREWDDEFEQTKCDWTGGQQGRKYKGIAALHRQAFLKMGLRDRFMHEMQFPARHRQVIEHALAIGLPVPAGALADYPDLAEVPAGHD